MLIIIAVVIVFSSSYKLTEVIVGTARENEMKQCKKVQFENLASCEDLFQGKK
jgi:hypothetical protein